MCFAQAKEGERTSQHRQQFAKLRDGVCQDVPNRENAPDLEEDNYSNITVAQLLLRKIQFFQSVGSLTRC